MELIFCIFPSWHPPPGTARSSGQPPGDQVQVPGPVLVRDRTEGHLFFLHVFVVVGFYGGNPGEHGENMQTPHRKAREQAPTCCTMRDLNPRPSCCEATVLRTKILVPFCKFGTCAKRVIIMFTLPNPRTNGGKY